MKRNSSAQKKVSLAPLFPKDLVCFSHLRWNFVYQRPQHLLSRFARDSRVFFIEEPIFDSDYNTLRVELSPENVWIVVPHLKAGMAHGDLVSVQKELINAYFSREKIERFILWYYTPMALEISDHLVAEVVVYDCMDELSAFKFAPAALKERELQLLNRADLVFTGGHSLYEAKKHSHHNIHPFPSSIDKAHFSMARLQQEDPEDQAAIPHPRMGFFGVIDERMNIELVGEIAEKRPDWHFVIIGPVVKIDPASLPAQPNIHYLGSKGYNDLPRYLSGWDVSIIPFALNESTRYISPTKTPEYLAAGTPVISTSIRDVVRPYGNNGLVSVADSADEFISCGIHELNRTDKEGWLKTVDDFLADNSWNNTWKNMKTRIQEVLLKRNSVPAKKEFRPAKKQSVHVIGEAQIIALATVQQKVSV